MSRCFVNLIWVLYIKFIGYEIIKCLVRFLVMIEKSFKRKVNLKWCVFVVEFIVVKDGVLENLEFFVLVLSIMDFWVMVRFDF